MSITNVYTEPGVYSQFKPSGNLPTIPGGVRVAALVGAGRTTNIVSQEQVTKGSLNAVDALAHTALTLGAQIVDEDFNTYYSGIDYQLTTGEVDWSLTGPASLVGTEVSPFTGLVGKTIQITVDGGAPQSYTFLAGDFGIPTAARADEVKDAINAAIPGLACTGSASVGSAVTIATIAGDNTSILIGTGTSNSTLGFVDGSFQETPREPAPGKKYFANYEYAKSSSDYSVRFFFNMSDVIAEHGEVSTTDTLSLGAEILFQHGASAVCLVQIDPADGAVIQQFRKAIDKLLPVDGINIVVPLNPDPGLYSYLSSHVDQASSITERKERTGILGLSGTPSISTIQGYATGLANKRIVLVYPQSCTRFVGADTTVSTLDGSFLACAIAGIRTSTTYDVADPLTRKELIGFENIPDTLLRAEKNQLASSGVLVIENVGGIFRVRHQKTTDISTVPNSEYSVVEIVDYVAVSMRKILEAIYIGQKILADTPSQVRSTTNAVLQDLVSREIIVAFTNIQASINNIDPTQIDVQFSISPVYPLNYILVTFSLSTNQ